MDEKKKVWGRPKGKPQTEETKKKISEAVKKSFKDFKSDKL
jgi:hypothetical protein